MFCAQEDAALSTSHCKAFCESRVPKLGAVREADFEIAPKCRKKMRRRIVVYEHRESSMVHYTN